MKKIVVDGNAVMRGEIAKTLFKYKMERGILKDLISTQLYSCSELTRDVFHDKFDSGSIWYAAGALVKDGDMIKHYVCECQHCAIISFHEEFGGNSLDRARKLCDNGYVCTFCGERSFPDIEAMSSSDGVLFSLSPHRRFTGYLDLPISSQDLADASAPNTRYERLIKWLRRG